MANFEREGLQHGEGGSMVPKKKLQNPDTNAYARA